MDKTLIAGGALAALMTAAVAGTVSAQAVADATGLTADQAIEIALAEVPGALQEVERERDDGMQLFEVAILTAEGDLTEVEVNAETGEILEVEVEGMDEDCDHDDDDSDSDDA